jgi:DNA-binding NarL/FixJ family response regulator
MGHVSFLASDLKAAKLATLTKCECEAVTLGSRGWRNKQLAEQLFISEAPVRHHLSAIFTKLRVTNRLELMIYTYRHGLAKLSQQHFPCLFSCA